MRRLVLKGRLGKDRKAWQEKQQFRRVWESQVWFNESLELSWRQRAWRCVGVMSGLEEWVYWLNFRKKTKVVDCGALLVCSISRPPILRDRWSLGSVLETIYRPFLIHKCFLLFSTIHSLLSLWAFAGKNLSPVPTISYNTDSCLLQAWAHLHQNSSGCFKKADFWTLLHAY